MGPALGCISRIGPHTPQRPLIRRTLRNWQLRPMVSCSMDLSAHAKGCYRQVTPNFLDSSDPNRTMPTIEETLSHADKLGPIWPQWVLMAITR